MVDRVAASVDKGLKDPSSEDGKALQEAGIPPWLARKAQERLDPATRDQLTQQMVKMCAIHEMGHACGVPGHLNGKGAEDQDVQRESTCPSHYLNVVGRRLFILNGTLSGEGSFCNNPPDRCWSRVKVKD